MRAEAAPPPASIQQTPGEPTVTVTDVWTKEMTRSDAQQVSASSNPTGVLARRG